MNKEAGRTFSGVPTFEYQKSLLQVGFGSGSMCRNLIGLNILGIQSLYTTVATDVGISIGDVVVESCSSLLLVAGSGRRVKIVLFTSFEEQVIKLFQPYENVEFVTKNQWLTSQWKAFFNRGIPREEGLQEYTDTLFCLCINSCFIPGLLFKTLQVETIPSPSLIDQGCKVMLKPHSHVVDFCHSVLKGGSFSNIYFFRPFVRKMGLFFSKGSFIEHKAMLLDSASYGLEVPRGRDANNSVIAFYLGRFRVNGLTTAVRNCCLEMQSTFPVLGITKVLLIVSRVDATNVVTTIKQYFKDFCFPFEVVILEDHVTAGLRKLVDESFWATRPGLSKEIRMAAIEAYEKLFSEGSPRVIFNRTGYDIVASLIFAVGRPRDTQAFIWAPNHMVYEWLLRFPRLRWVFATYHLYSKVILVSESSLRDNKRLFNWIGLPSDKALVLRNFLPPAPPVQPFPGPHISGSSPLRLLWVGRFSPEKNPWLVIQAAKQLWLNGADFSLTMIGNGPLWSSCKEFAFSNSRAIPISFSGEERSLDIRAFSRFDVLVNTSLYEGLPNTFYEGLVNGISFFAPMSRWGFEVEKIAPAQVKLYPPNVQGLISLIKKEMSVSEQRRHRSRQTDNATAPISQPFQDYFNLLYSNPQP